MRVGFAGTPAFAARALDAIARAGYTIPLVLTQPDRPKGRGLKLEPSPVKSLALSLGLPVLQPATLKIDGARAPALAVPLDVLVVAAYGLILPRWVLDLPRLGCLNIHGSLLPRWRGAAPIYRAIEAGDAETGITIMQMDEGLDTGDMLLIAREPIGAADSTARLHDRLATLGGALIVEALDQAAAGALQATRQPAEGVTYAHKIEKAEAAIDWALPAAQIERRVRAFDPFPGANFQRGADTIKVWQAECVAGEGEPGEVLATSADGIVVACGEGALRLTQLQRPGGKRAAARELLAALPIAVGERLGERIDGLAG